MTATTTKEIPLPTKSAVNTAGRRREGDPGEEESYRQSHVPDRPDGGHRSGPILASDQRRHDGLLDRLLDRSAAVSNTVSTRKPVKSETNAKQTYPMPRSSRRTT